MDSDKLVQGGSEIKIGLGIPFWGDDPLRVRNHEWVVSRMIERYPFDKVISRTDGYVTRGGSRNHLMDRLADMDVVVLCDADTVVDSEPLREAVWAAHRDGGVHFPYSTYHYLTETATRSLLFGNGSVTSTVMDGPGSLGGVIVVDPAEWWRAGGSPEINGWGFEDVIFSIQARTFLDTDLRWHPGRLTHLYHPTECATGTEQYNINITVCKEVENLDGDVWALSNYMRTGPNRKLWPIT